MRAFVRFFESLNIGCLTFCTESFEFDWWENLEKFREETYFRGGDTLCIKLNSNPINIIIIFIIIIVIITVMVVNIIIIIAIIVVIIIISTTLSLSDELCIKIHT